MLQILHQSQGNIVATKVTGKVTGIDYLKLLPLLNDRFRQYEKIRWYFEMENFTGWNLTVFWEDVKFDLRHAKDFERIALVGDKAWQEWMTSFMQPFNNAQIEFFEVGHRELAWEWITSNL